MVSTARLLFSCGQFKSSEFLINQILEQLHACQHRVSTFMIHAYNLFIYGHAAFNVSHKTLASVSFWIDGSLICLRADFGYWGGEERKKLFPSNQSLHAADL